MKPRILKKLSRRVYEIAGDRFDVPYRDEEPIGSLAYDFKVRPKAEVTAKVFRDHCNAMSNIRGCLVVGGGPDYWGEYDDPVTLFAAAKEAVLWEFGLPRSWKDAEGDLHPDWPSWPRRLTGKEVIRLLRIMPEPRQGRGGGE